jgi:hypothetical protein
MWHQVLKRRQRKEENKRYQELKKKHKANEKDGGDSSGDDGAAQSTELIYMKIEKDLAMKRKKKDRRLEQSMKDNEGEDDEQERLQTRRIDKIIHLHEYTRFLHDRVRYVWLYWHVEDYMHEIEEIEKGNAKQILDETAKGNSKQIAQIDALAEFCLKRSVDWVLAFAVEKPYKNVAKDIFKKHMFEGGDVEESLDKSKVFEKKNIEYRDRTIGFGFDLADEVKNYLKSFEEGDSKFAKGVHQIRDLFDKIFKGMHKEVFKRLEEGLDTIKENFDDYMNLKQVLESEFLHTRSVDDTAASLNELIEEMWRKSRMPPENRAESIYILRHAWNAVDIYWHYASWYKFFAKLSYVLLLFIGAVVAILTVLNLELNMFVTTGPQLRPMVIFLTGASSAIAAVTTFFNPEKRWLVLRAAALTLESEIWKFRLSFAINVKTESRQREEELREFVNKMLDQVSKSAAVGSTSLYATLDIFGDPNPEQRRLCRHGQFQVWGLNPGMGSCCGANPVWITKLIPYFGGGFALDNTYQDQARHINSRYNTAIPFGWCCTKSSRTAPDPDDPDDDHHSALDPEDYIDLRVKPLTYFYQKRIPSYHVRYQLWEFIIVGGSLVGTLLSAFNYAAYTSMITACTGIVVAWRSYNATEAKLQRYNNTVEKINTVLPWWRQLTQIEKSTPGNIQRLVDECEEIFRGEWDTWCTTSMKLQKMAKKTQDKNSTTLDVEDKKAAKKEE